MKHLKLFEEFDFNDEDFDFEELPDSEKPYEKYISNYNNRGKSDKIYFIIPNNNEIFDFIKDIENDGFNPIGWDDKIERINNNEYYNIYFVLWQDKLYSVTTDTESFDYISSEKEIVTL